jgi:hypothetical protein
MANNAPKMKKLIERALEGIERESIGEQIELQEAAAIAISAYDNAAAEISMHAARLLREAEAHQLKFRELLKS